MKIKTAELAQALRGAAQTILAQSEKLAEYERGARVNRLIAKMAEKGIQSELSDDDLRDTLLKKASEGKLSAVEEGVELSTGMSTIKVASSDGPGSARASSISGAELDAFVMTGE